jgi:hypothetical protein
MSTWKEQVYNLLDNTYGHGQVFTLEEITKEAEAAGIFELHPEAKTPEATLRRVLQELRDDGRLAFIEPGCYARIWRA